MKKNYFIVSLVQSFIIITLALLFSVAANSQYLSPEQKQQRCQNNKDRLAELEKQLGTVNAELLTIPEKKEIEDARSEMVFVNKLSRGGGISIIEEENRLARIGAKYNFDVMTLHNVIVK